MATEKHPHKFNQGLNTESSKKYLQTKKMSVIERVNIETYRLLRCLNFPISLKKLIIDKFMNFWSAFNPGIKFRNLEKLVLLAIYFILKYQEFKFNEIELLRMSNI